MSLLFASRGVHYHYTIQLRGVVDASLTCQPMHPHLYLTWRSYCIPSRCIGYPHHVTGTAWVCPVTSWYNPTGRPGGHKQKKAWNNHIYEGNKHEIPPALCLLEAHPLIGTTLTSAWQIIDDVLLRFGSAAAGDGGCSLSESSSCWLSHDIRSSVEGGGYESGVRHIAKQMSS